MASACNWEGDALRQPLADPRGVVQRWDPTLVNPCTWFHVTCNRDSLVTRVRLNDNRLTGPIPRELTKTSSLKVILNDNPILEGPELQGLAIYVTNC